MTSTAFATPVYLTPSSLLDISPGGLVFYDVIPSNVVSRCSVLAYAAEAEGDARLPDAVTLPDFKTWLTAVPWTAACTQKRDIDFRSLCIIAKVADVLDDSRMGAWVDLLAERLLQLATGRDPGTHEREVASGHEAAEVMSALPYHVQGQVFAAAQAVADRWYYQQLYRSSPAEKPAVYSLLDWLPQSMHATIVAGTVTANKALTLQLVQTARSLIDALAALPAAPPPLLSLTLHGQRHESSHDWEPQHLGSMLTHHSGLSSLCLYSPCTRPDVFAVLAPALATLTAMTSLRLGSAFTCIAENSLLDLKAVLHSMPRLQELATAITLDDPGISRLKRQRDASDGDGAPPQRCLCGTLAAATALTSLSIEVDHTRQLQARTCCCDVTLPRLSWLHVTVDSCRWASTFLSRLTAPLTALIFTDMPDNSDFDEAAEIAPFVMWLPKFTSLQHLGACPGHFDTWVDRALTTLLAGAPPGLRPLPRLRSLEADPHKQALHAAAPSLHTVFPGLHTLTMTLQDNLDPGAHPNGWPATMRHLCRLPLQHLRLWLVNSRPELPDLVPLAALTALRLFEDEHLTTAAGVSALGRMSQLQHLHVDRHSYAGGGRDGADAVCWEELLLPRLAALPRLTTLVIADTPVPARALAAGGVSEAWPALRRLGLAVRCCRQQMQDALSELVGAAAALPRLEALVLGDGLEIAATLRGPAQEMAGGTCMAASEQLHQTAGRAGFALSFDDLGSLWDMDASAGVS